VANFTGIAIPSPAEFGASPTATGLCMPQNPEFGFATPQGQGPLTLTFLDPIPPNLPSPGRSLLFQVTGLLEGNEATIVAEYDTGAYEVVHDGTDFAQVYAAQSSRTAITGGFEYLVKRAGGWFGDFVTIRTIAAGASA